MMMIQRLLLIYLLILLPSAAFAYLDPLSGSLLIQGLVAGFLTALYFVKRKWKQLCQLLGFSKKEDAQEDKNNDAKTDSDDASQNKN